MLLQLQSSVSNLPRPSRILLGAACATFVLVSLLGSRHVHVPKEVVDQHVIKQSGGLYRIPNGPPPTVNLVVAAMAREDYSWVKDLKVPGMSIVPYIADNQSALYHPVQNKGHEAMVFLSYFRDFYDDLPDISILIHSSQRSWHVEELLDQSMIFSLNHLDLREVQRRGFVNLRVTWGIGCSSGSINTTRVFENSGVTEEREMREAFRANFNVYNVPEILATPCCSQIAVTKERIQSVPREQYQHHINWLLKTGLKDEISGRTWEHVRILLEVPFPLSGTFLSCGILLLTRTHETWPTLLISNSNNANLDIFYRCGNICSCRKPSIVRSNTRHTVDYITYVLEATKHTMNG